MDGHGGHINDKTRRSRRNWAAHAVAEPKGAQSDDCQMKKRWADADEWPEELKEVAAAEAAVAAEAVEADIPEQQVAETPEAAATAVAVAEVTTGTPVQYDMAEWHLLSDEC